ncbi:MGMT family protein [Methylovorus menthalis]|uniref:methylated-DNA--[protein]-cysteine S-methyltransferase n=1 Tax=Methylovorus menthalis TaxID=1002227 RepID=UPI001E616E94|nr:MGMT family protein [Methylovorus menthalis]MCB4810871.1 MGMT family protein [Methylovorus menthalis]
MNAGNTPHDYDAIITAPFGAIGLRVQDDFVVGIELLAETLEPHAAPLPFVQHAVHELQQYLLDPARLIDLPYLTGGTLFQQRVWKAIADIPSGEALSYSQLAQCVHSGPRAVANVCGANRVPLLVPCHRVVAKSGLGGFMQGNPRGLAIKQWLLAHEGFA